MSFWKWSRTASANATADGSINWAEGQPPSSVNDSARAMMAAAAKYRDDIAGAIVTGGTATAYTVASYQGFDSLAAMSGAMLAFTPHATCGATVTLNVDGLGAKPLRLAPGGSNELPAGTLVQGTPYVATYYNAAGEWILRALAGNPYSIPLGGMIEFTGTTAPNGSFVLPFGQAISRVTYAAYFALVGATYGAGDGSTTFNVIDKRGRVSAGKDDMGGAAAGRITSAGASIDATILGANGGAQTITLAQSALPNVSPTFTGAATGALPTTHFPLMRADTVGGAPIQIGSGTNAAQQAANTITVNSFTPAGTISSINGGVTQTAVNKMPPAIIVNYLLRVL